MGVSHFKLIIQIKKIEIAKTKSMQNQGCWRRPALVQLPLFPCKLGQSVSEIHLVGKNSTKSNKLNPLQTPCLFIHWIKASIKQLIISKIKVNKAIHAICSLLFLF